MSNIKENIVLSYKQKAGMGDKVIRRNSLTTLHPLPKVEPKPSSPAMERQRTVPHGFNVRYSSILLVKVLTHILSHTCKAAKLVTCTPRGRLNKLTNS